MKYGNMNQYKSWLLSGGVIVAVALWLVSGQFGDKPDADLSLENSTMMSTASKGAVRVRTQSAEQVLRTITVNGKTAPARVVELSAETDGRIVSIGAERGSNVERTGLIVRLDERDRNARLAQAEATVKQREVEYDGRLRLKSESYVSEAQLQEAVALLETAKAELTRAQLDLSYMFIRAPFAGALQSRAVEIIERRIVVASPGSNAATRGESLGKRMIEGVEADGTRYTTVIPAGQIGNEREIEVVFERWHSAELGVDVSTKRSDPRSGVTAPPT